MPTQAELAPYTTESMGSERPLYALDIETTDLAWPSARITTVAIDNPQVSFVLEDSDEARLIRHLAGHLGDLPAGTVCTWNGAVFDGPFLAGRTGALGLDKWFELAPDPCIVPKYEPQPGFAPVGHHPILPATGGQVHDHLDVAYRWGDWATANGVRWSLKAVARAVGVEVIEVDRAHMDGLSVAERMAYNLSDVVATYRRPAARRHSPMLAAALLNRRGPWAD